MISNPTSSVNGRAAMPPGVTLTTLDNGLVIIVREDNSAPVVSAQAWCMAGSIHEGKWLGAGMSHVLEHMLFKGTTTRPGSRIDQEVQEAGGYMNAYTSFDRTVYHIDVPSTGAKVAIDILCDIMQNATLPPDELAKEQQVILREMDMNIDDPGRRASRRLFETAYTKSPYRFTIIGYPDIFHELKPEDIRSYYREKYAPNNVFYVIAGDIKNEQVIAQIREAYSKAKAQAMAPVTLPVEPRQVAPREVIEEAPIELGHLHYGWHMPEVRHPDVPVLDVLAAVLGNGRSSRLYQQVREKKALVHSVDVWTYSPGEPGLFGMSATVDAERYLAARDAMMAEVEAIKTNPVSSEELQKAVKQFVASSLSARKTMAGQAQDLGANWLAASDLSFSERYLAAVKRVTPAELQRVAIQYLTEENSTHYALMPEGTKPATKKESSTVSAHAIQKFVLPNGLRLLLREEHRLPFIEFRCVFQGGVLTEDEEKNGVTQLATRLLLKGTSSRTAEDIATAIESVGGSIDTYGGNNSFGVSAEVMNGDFALGLDLLADVLLYPSFPESALEREKQVQLAAIRAQKDHMLQSAAQGMRRALFGNTGYGLDALGTEKSVQKIQVTDLKRFHNLRIRPDNCVLAIYGDINIMEVGDAVEKAFGQWEKSPTIVSAQAKPGGVTSVQRVLETRDKKQAVLVIGFNGTTLHAPDRYALELLQEACSDLGSRLFLRIREQLGLAYYVGAQNFVGLVPGYFAFYAGTMPEKTEVVETELLKEAELLRNEGLTAEELNRAKAKVVGQKKIARQDLGSLAMATALDELYGLGFSFIDEEAAYYEAVTLEEVKAVARKYLSPDALVVSLIKPPN